MVSRSDRDAPVLEEGRGEYHLYVPYDLRYRARRIEGRRWDPARRCWALPKTPGVLEELRLEFGEALVSQVEGGARRHGARRWRDARSWVQLAVVLVAILGISALIGLL